MTQFYHRELGMTAEFTIREDFRDLIPPLADDEYEQLETNVLEDGCRDALVVWSTGKVLLDGHNRYEICTNHRIPYSTRTIDLKDEAAAEDWIIRNQLGRRNLAPGPLAALRGRLYNRVKKAHGRPEKSGQNDQFLNSKNLADELGVSPRTIRREAKAVAALEDHPEKMKEVMTGKKSLHQAAREVVPPKPKIVHRETHPVCDAHKYADMAILQLERIRNDDPTAAQELGRVANWIKEREAEL